MTEMQWRGHTMYQCDDCAFTTLDGDVYDAHVLDHAPPPENPMIVQRREAAEAKKAARAKKKEVSDAKNKPHGTSGS